MRGYFQMSTANPTGQRPWNFAWQTSRTALSAFDPRVRTLNGVPALGRLGINILAQLPATAQQQVQSIITYLQQAQSDINATNQAILQGNAAGIDMSDIAAQNQANQNQLNTLTDEFTIGYRAMTGTTPPGLSGARLGRLRGLGQIDPGSWLTIAGAVVALGILAAATYALIQQTSANRTNAQAKLTQQQTISSQQQQTASLQNQAAAACASGDPSCQTLTSLANQAGQDLTALNTGNPNPNAPSWWTDPNQALIPSFPNYVLIGAVAALMVVPPLLKKFF